MLSFQAVGFEWDESNSGHCRKHGMELAEIESVFHGQPLVAPDPKHSMHEARFVAAGRTDGGRAAFVVFTMRGGHIRPLSARYMHAKEARKYGSQGSDI